MDKRKARMRRATKTRSKIKKLAMHRLCIYRSLNHIYAQIISPCGVRVLTTASTAEKEIRTKVKHTGNKDAAMLVGELIAKRAKEAGIQQVAFDRGGYKYHGRVKALADAARDGGLEF